MHWAEANIKGVSVGKRAVCNKVQQLPCIFRLDVGKILVMVEVIKHWWQAAKSLFWELF